MKPLYTDRELAMLDEGDRLRRIRYIIEAVDSRCAAADGPVTPSLQEMRQDEISAISGEGDDFAVVVAYLPEGADPSGPTLWPEATEVESGEPVKHPTYTSRLRKPEWWTGP